MSWPQNVNRIADRLGSLRQKRSDIDVLKICSETYLDSSNQPNNLPFRLQIEEIKRLSANYNLALSKLQKEGLIHYPVWGDEILGVAYAATDIWQILIENVKDDYTLYDMLFQPLKSQKNIIYTLDKICTEELHRNSENKEIKHLSLIHHDQSMLEQKGGEFLVEAPIEIYNLYKFSLDIFLENLKVSECQRKPFVRRSSPRSKKIK